MCSNRKVVKFQLFSSFGSKYLDCRVFGLVPALNNYFFLEACLLVRFLTEGNTLNQVIVSDLSTQFSYNNSVERVPFAYELTLFNFLARLNIKL
jgi:hypothetical protein